MLENSTIDEPRTDLVVLDDASEESVKDVIEERFCVPVIRSRHPEGLSWHWNRCFSLHRKWGYAAVIIANNDIIIPAGSLKEFVDVLLDPSLTEVHWVGPLSSPDSLAQAHRQQHVWRVHTYLPSSLHVGSIPQEKAQYMQDAITHPEWFNATAPPRIRALDDKEQLIYGFFFGIRNLTRRSLIRIGGGLNIGQETAFKYYMQGYVASRSFVFHHKSATLKSGPNVDRNDVLICHRKHMRTNNQSKRVFNS